MTSLIMSLCKGSIENVLFDASLMQFQTEDRNLLQSRHAEDDVSLGAVLG